MAMKKVRKADTLSIHYSLFYSSLLTEQAMRLLFRKALTEAFCDAHSKQKRLLLDRIQENTEEK